MRIIRTIFNVIILSIILSVGWEVLSHASSVNNKAITTEETAAAKDKTSAEKAAALAGSKKILSNLVSTFTSPYSTNVGVVVTDLSNGASASANDNKQFVSASLYKLYVAYGIYKKVDEGTFSLNMTVTTDSENDTNTIAGCLNLMITISDNNCGDTLGNLVGWASLDSLLSSEGYTETLLNNYDDNGNLNGDKLTTAHDVALLLTRLYDGSLLSTASSNAYLSLLKAQTINDRLPTGLPDGTVIAHKTGDLYGYLHDVGIIYGTNKNMLVVLLTGEWDTPQTQGIPLFTKLASDTWSYMQS